MICHAVAIYLYGMDAGKVAEKRKKGRGREADIKAR